jgi:aldehyde dehydrogenase (NAD+)
MDTQQQQANYFNSYATRSYVFRKQQLTNLKLAIQQNEEDILAALHADLGKSAEEAYASEVGFVLAEITTTLKNLQGWMKPKKVSTNLLNIPGYCGTFGCGANYCSLELSFSIGHCTFNWCYRCR